MSDAFAYETLHPALPIDSSLLTVPAEGSISALFGGFGDDDDDGNDVLIGRGLGDLDVVTSLLIATALPRHALFALVCTTRHVCVLLRSEKAWQTAYLAPLKPGARIVFCTSWRRTAIEASRRRARPRKRVQALPLRNVPKTQALRGRPRRIGIPLQSQPKPARRLPCEFKVCDAIDDWKTALMAAVETFERNAGMSTESWKTISPAQFKRNFDVPHRPLLGTKAIRASSGNTAESDYARFFRLRGWPHEWRPQRLLQTIQRYCRSNGHGRTLLGVIAPFGKVVKMTLRSFFHYVDCNQDAQEPLYLFDSGPVAAALLQAVDAPAHFEDLLQDLAGRVLVRGLERQYLTIGPPRSGARFHIDPFAASAASLLLSGQKVWALYPPSTTPPGVRVVRCESQLVHESPPSIWWWRHVFLPNANGRSPANNPYIFIQRPGDIVFTPSGWWHATLNLGSAPAVALTRHICTTSNAPRMVEELRRHGWGEAATWLANEMWERHQ